MRIMNRTLFLPVLSILITLPSCGDTDEARLLVNEGRDEIGICRLGGSVDVPVEADGRWLVTVEGTPDDVFPEWLDVERNEGNGPGTFTIDIDYFSPMAQKHERTADIVIRDGERKKKLRVRQYIGLNDGETVDNASTEPFADLWSFKGIGAGFNILTGKQSYNMVLNPGGLIALASSGDPDYATLFRQTVHPDSKNHVIFTDTLEINDSRLGATCDLDVRYAAFRLNLNVAYSNSGQQIHNKKTYNASQSVVFLSSYTDVSTIQAMLEEDPDFREQPTRQIVSNGFRATYRKVIKAYEEGDEEDFGEVVKDMLDGFGAAFITGADLGGSLFVSMRCDSVLMEDKYSVGGELTAGILLGGISISASVSATHSRFGKEIWKNSEHYVSASGGDKAALNSLLAAISVAEPDEGLLRKASGQWIDSIVSSDDVSDNTSAVRVSYSPVWILFPPDVARKIRQYAIEYYKDKRICTLPVGEIGIL